MVYLDHAATTDLRDDVRQAWLSAASVTGNPASLHSGGRRARRLVEESRERIAAALAVPPSTVVFTSGGTESDNIAVTGTMSARMQSDADLVRVVMAPSEHKAVLEPASAAPGASVTWIDVDAQGIVSPESVEDVLTSSYASVGMVSVMAVNNEVGTIQPVSEIAALTAAHGVPLHVDAVQALGVVPLDLSAVTTAAFSAHKVGGPAGVGLLYVAPGADVTPLVRGGGHESGLRAGTLAVAGIAATAVAVERAVAEREAHVMHQAALRRRLLAGLAELSEVDLVLNSAAGSVPGIVNVAFPGCESDALMMLLDARGVEVSTGSACTVGIPRPSHVLLAMGRDPAAARSAIRISTGRTSTAADIDALLVALPEAVARARRAGLVAGVGS